jgi:hypothetical protein
MFKTTPDDERIEEMDPVQRVWMFNNWVADRNEQAELTKNHAYLLASFWNPEAVDKIMNKDDVIISSSEEAYEESTQMVKEGRIDLSTKNNDPPSLLGRRRRRHSLKRS